jgi:hypothetical protein
MRAGSTGGRFNVPTAGVGRVSAADVCNVHTDRNLDSSPAERTPVSPRGTTVDGPVLRRAVRPVGAFVLVVVAGVSGFVAVGGVGVVEAAFWLVDPASIAIHYQTHEGGRTVKAYAVVVFATLVLVGVWIGETVLTTAFGGQMREELRRVQTRRAIDDVRDHVIICGYGLFGRTVARRLRRDGRDVVAVERDRAVFDGIDEESVLAVEGDARNEETLRSAGLTDATAVVAAIDDSNANIQIAITASQVAPDVRVVVRVGDEDYTSVARRAGADEVVIPEVSSGEDVSESL